MQRETRKWSDCHLRSTCHARSFFCLETNLIPGPHNHKKDCILTAYNQPVAKCKQSKPAGKSKPLQSHPCSLLTVMSHLSSGSSWGQLLWLSAPKKQIWRQVSLGEWSWGAPTLFARALCSQCQLRNKPCMSAHHLPLLTNPLPWMNREQQCYIASAFGRDW